MLDKVQLNWLPPTESNGETHYVISYTPDGGTEQSIYIIHIASLDESSCSDVGTVYEEFNA